MCDKKGTETDEHDCKYKAALLAIDRLKPDDFRTGQSHVPPAFREINASSLMLRICTIINGALYDTDAHGTPLPAQS